MGLLPVLAALAVAAPAAEPTGTTRLTLDEALGEASRANPDLLLARNQVQLAGVDVYASWSGVLPRLDLTGAFGRDLYPSPVNDIGDHSLALTLQLPLFDGARSWNAIRRARVAATGTERSLDETTLAVAFDVMRRFYEVVKAREQLRVLVATVDRSEEFARRTEALFEAGRASRADVLMARGNAGTDRIAAEQAQARLDQVRADLATAIGRDRTAGFDVVPPATLAGPAGAQDVDPPDETTLLADARRSRPLLAAQAQAVRAAEVDESIARGAWFPVIGVQASYTRVSTIFAGEGGVFGDLSRQYAATAQLVLQWNLFAGRQTLAAERRAALTTGRSRTQSRQAELQVAGEIARARASVVALQRARAIAAQNLVHAQQGVEVARDRLQAGAAQQLELRDANLKLTQAELDVLDTTIDAIVARADLRRAVGSTP